MMARLKPCLACRAVKTGLIRAEDREKEKKHEFERQTVEVCSAGPMLLVCHCLARIDNSLDRPCDPSPQQSYDHKLHLQPRLRRPQNLSLSFKSPRRMYTNKHIYLDAKMLSS